MDDRPPTLEQVESALAAVREAFVNRQSPIHPESGMLRAIGILSWLKRAIPSTEPAVDWWVPTTKYLEPPYREDNVMPAYWLDHGSWLK